MLHFCRKLYLSMKGSKGLFLFYGNYFLRLYYLQFLTLVWKINLHSSLKFKWTQLLPWEMVSFISGLKPHDWFFILINYKQAFFELWPTVTFIWALKGYTRRKFDQNSYNQLKCYFVFFLYSTIPKFWGA